MISIRNLTKYYDQVPVVQDVSLEIPTGSTLAILGTSGSGKTTLLKLINRLIEADAGEVEIHDRSIAQMNPVALRRQIGYVFQDIGLFPHWTIYENLTAVPNLLHWPIAQIKSAATNWMTQLQLPAEYYDRYPHMLSGGEQQRVGIGRALISEPDLVLMDEPFGALDAITREQLQLDFIRIDRLAEMTALIVTHDVAEAFLLGDQVALMDSGQVVQVGDPKSFLLNPASGFVRDFLAGQYAALAQQYITLGDLDLAGDPPDSYSPEPEHLQSELTLNEFMGLAAGKDGQQTILLTREQEPLMKTTMSSLAYAVTKFLHTG